MSAKGPGADTDGQFRGGGCFLPGCWWQGEQEGGVGQDRKRIQTCTGVLWRACESWSLAFNHSSVYLFIHQQSMYMSNATGIVSRTRGQNCQSAPPSLREQPKSISPARILGPWFISLRHRTMCSAFSGCKDHQNKRHGGHREVNKKRCLFFTIPPLTLTRRGACVPAGHTRKALHWISLNVSLYS